VRLLVETHADHGRAGVEIERGMPAVEDAGIDDDDSERRSVGDEELPEVVQAAGRDRLARERIGVPADGERFRVEKRQGLHAWDGARSNRGAGAVSSSAIW
jgi:hypothetical protein